MADTGSQSAGKTAQVTEWELGWFVAMLEAEGHIGLYRNPKDNWIIQVGFCNTDYAIIERYADILRRLGIGRFIQVARVTSDKHHPRKEVMVSGQRRSLPLLELVEPLLVGAKRIKAQLVLAYSYSRLMQPGGGRRRGGVPLSLRALRAIDLMKHLSRNPNEHTPDVAAEAAMMCSELRRQYAESAEMAGRLAS